ncbi:hypothetical protein [Sporosarcina globispora]|uniref:hypothetical protein n=1 Tax=Sporosarcina globispora TaxID=1459 RepID=UPI000AB3909E|nr:hypothetical protein [Sporosarcina globispora]
MNQKQKSFVVQKIIQTLAENKVSYAEVTQILAELEVELKEMSQQQIIQIP